MQGRHCAQWKEEENHPLPSGGDPEHWVISLWCNVWRIYLLVDDKATPTWPCSYLKHPDVWEIQSGACSCYFILFWEQNCWMSWVSLVWGGGDDKKILVFIIPCHDSIQGFDDGSNQKFLSWINCYLVSLTLQSIKSQQCLSDAELICEKSALFPSLQTASTWASEHL